MSGVTDAFPVLPLLPVATSKVSAGRAERRKRLLAGGLAQRVARTDGSSHRSQGVDDSGSSQAAKKKAWKTVPGKKKYNRASSKREAQAQVGDYYYDSLERSSPPESSANLPGGFAGTEREEDMGVLASPRRLLTQASMCLATAPQSPAPGPTADRRRARSRSGVTRGRGRGGSRSSTLPNVAKVETKGKKRKSKREAVEPVEQDRDISEERDSRRSTREALRRNRKATSSIDKSTAAEKKARRRSLLDPPVPKLQMAINMLTKTERAPAKAPPTQDSASPCSSASNSPRSRKGSSPVTPRFGSPKASPRSIGSSPRTPRRSGSQVFSPRSHAQSPPQGPGGPKKKAGLSSRQVAELSHVGQGQSLRTSDSMVKVTTLDHETFQTHFKSQRQAYDTTEMDTTDAMLSPPICSTYGYVWKGNDHMGDDDGPVFTLDAAASDTDPDEDMEDSAFEAGSSPPSVSPYLRTSVGSVDTVMTDNSQAPSKLGEQQLQYGYRVKPQQQQQQQQEQQQQQQQQQHQHQQQTQQHQYTSSPGAFATPSSSSGRSLTFGRFKTSKDSPQPIISNKWNEIFQKNMQDLHQLHSSQQDLQCPSLERSIAVYDKLHELAQNFAYTAATFGKVIIAEHHLPEHLKTVRTARIGGQAGGKKYLAHDVVFKFAVDDKNIYDNNDDLAMKVAGHELKSMDTLLSCNIPGLYFPLISIVDYRGYRLLAVSSLPISTFTLLVGSANAGKTVQMRCDQLLSKMSLACEHLNLKKHRVGSSLDGPELCGPIDMEGHLGTDKRHYLLDFSRLFPPDMVDRNKPNSYLYELFRPEFVKQYEKSLCSDACSQFVANQPDAKQHELDVQEAHFHLVSVTIPGFVSLLLGLKGGAAELFLNAPRHLVLSIHRQGINMRYLGRLRSLMLCHRPDPEAHWNKLLLVEMIARVMKCRLRQRLRDLGNGCDGGYTHPELPSDVGYKREIVAFLNLYLAQTEATEQLWTRELPRALLEKFENGLSSDEMTPGVLFKAMFFSESSIPNPMRCMVFKRLLDMVGFQCTPSALDKFTTSGHAFQCARPFNDIHISEITVRVKHLNLLEHSSGMLLKLQAQQSSAEGHASSVDDSTVKQLLQLSLECFERALQCNPSNPSTLVECADAYHLLGIKSRAKMLYQLAVSLGPHDSAVAHRYARFLIDCGEIEEAEDYLLLAYDLNPQNATEAMLDIAEVQAVHKKDLSAFQRVFEVVLMGMNPKEMHAKASYVRHRYCSILTSHGIATPSQALEKFNYAFGGILQRQ